MWGSVFLLKGFSPTRRWTFGAGYNHPAVVLKPLFKLGPVHHLMALSSNRKYYCSVGWSSQADLKLLSDHKTSKLTINRF